MEKLLEIRGFNINMDQVANRNIKERRHLIYQNTFYKGLDVSLYGMQQGGYEDA